MNGDAKVLGTPVVFGIPDEVLRLQLLRPLVETGVIQSVRMEFVNKAHGKIYVEYIPKERK